MARQSQITHTYRFRILLTSKVHLASLNKTWWEQPMLICWEHSLLNIHTSYPIPLAPIWSTPPLGYLSPHPYEWTFFHSYMHVKPPPLFPGSKFSLFWAILSTFSFLNKQITFQLGRGNLPISVLLNTFFLWVNQYPRPTSSWIKERREADKVLILAL